jgi:hypothetical protein
MCASSINLVIALPAEAKPITTRFGLRRMQPDEGFPVYRRDNISLVVCGPGKPNATAATAFLYALDGFRRDAIWVNLGVAGHALRNIGEPLLAREITDSGSGLSWHPRLCANSPCPADSLVTLDRPDLSYAWEGLADMEASGFYSTACRFSAVELVQVLKVVSDNRRAPARGMSAKQIRALVAGALDTLEELIPCLQTRAQQLHGHR